MCHIHYKENFNGWYSQPVRWYRISGRVVQLNRAVCHERPLFTDVTLIKVDVLKKIAKYFNVTTDYLLGVSDVKRDLQRQMIMNETLDEYYDLVEVYKELDPYDQEMIWSIIQVVKRTSDRRKSDNSTAVKAQKRVDKSAEYSDL